MPPNTNKVSLIPTKPCIARGTGGNPCTTSLPICDLLTKYTHTHTHTHCMHCIYALVKFCSICCVPLIAIAFYSVTLLRWSDVKEFRYIGDSVTIFILHSRLPCNIKMCHENKFAEFFNKQNMRALHRNKCLTGNINHAFWTKAPKPDHFHFFNFCDTQALTLNHTHTNFHTTYEHWQVTPPQIEPPTKKGRITTY